MSQNKYLDAAFKIGINICKQAIWSKDKCSWVSSNNPSSKSDTSIVYSSLEADFYNGISGISFFLSELYKSTNDSVIKLHLEGSLNFLLTCSHNNIDQFPWGFYTGKPGMAFALINGGRVLDNENYLNQGFSLLSGIEEDSGMDMINGSVGAIPLLCWLYSEYKEAKWKTLAINIGKNILLKSEQSEFGISWNTMEHKTFNLTGLAHGNAGYAWAFTELYRVTKNDEYLGHLDSCIQYENSCRASDKKNWSDFRNFDQKLNLDSRNTAGALAWCHGAPGIGLSRIRSYEITNRKKLIDNINDACELTSTSIKQDLERKTNNFSICHGIFGNADLLLYYNQVFKEDKYNNIINEAAEIGIVEFIIKDQDFPSGLHKSQPNCSFMLGDAGIGWFYLRMACKILKPSLFGL